MGDNFGAGVINIQPGDSNVPYHFKLTVCSSSRKNDGIMPYGSSVTSFAVTAHVQDGTVSYAKLISESSKAGSDGTDLIARLCYNSTLLAGIYHLTFAIVGKLGGESTMFKRTFDFNRVYVKDR